MKQMYGGQLVAHANKTLSGSLKANNPLMKQVFLPEWHFVIQAVFSDILIVIFYLINKETLLWIHKPTLHGGI